MLYNRYSNKVGFAHLFLCLILFIQSIEQNVYAQSSNSQPTIINSYYNVLKLKIDEGRNSLAEITTDKNSIGHYVYVQSLADVLELLLDENKANYKKFGSKEDDYLKELKKMEDNDPFKLFYEAEIKLQWALVKATYGDDLRAGLSLRSAWNTIQKNKNLFPSFKTNYKTIGLLHIIFGSVPDGYQWLLKVLGIRGDINTGLQQLDLISRFSPFYLESRIIKLVASVNILEKSDVILNEIKYLLESNKDNLLINYIYSSTLIKYHRSEEALDRFKKLLFMSEDYIFLNLINYQLGEIYIQKQDYAKSKDHYSKFLNDHQGRNFIKDSWFKIALCDWLSGNDKMAELHFEKADDSGTAFVSADKNANGILNGNKLPDRNLMKVRLATDGGYFEEAENILSGLNEDMFETKKEKTIYYYRQGRLKHELDDKDKAIYFYLFSIKKAGNENWYFAPNACLNTGYIYLEKNELDKARFYFEKVLSYKKHKYKSEIDIKAKTALATLGPPKTKKNKKN